MAAFSDFGTAGRAGILLVTLYDRVALWTLPAKDEDRYITAFRFGKFIVESGTDDTASGHDRVFHGTSRDLAVRNHKGCENKGNNGGGYEYLDPTDEFCHPACFFFLFFFVIFHKNNDNLV